MTALDYRLVDADNHCFEPRDSFTRYIDPAFRDQAVHQQIRDDGKEWIMIGEQPLTFLPGHDLYDNVGKPGSLKEKLRRMKKTGEAEEFSIFEPVRPEYLDRDLRLDVMDAQNVEACLMFPSVGVTVEHFMATPEQCYANFHAFNRWIQDDWGFAYQNRIFAPPMMSLWDLDAAVAELEWVLGEGAKVIALRPGPQYGRSPSDPYFDPFWARLNEAGGSVAFHLTESGYNEMVSPPIGAMSPTRRTSPCRPGSGPTATATAPSWRRCRRWCSRTSSAGSPTSPRCRWRTAPSGPPIWCGS